MLEMPKSLALSEKEITNEILKTIESFSTQFSSPSLTKVIQYQILSGGKRIRAKMAYILSIELGTSHDNAIIWACICETLHNASLIHDDLQDQDPYRRDQESLWKRFDAHTAITAGDFLIFLSIQMIQSLKLNDHIKIKLTELITKISMRLANGQFNELSLKLQPIESIWTSYLHTVEQKTSALFELPLVGAGLMSSRPELELYELKKLSNDFGQLFQVQDDIIDLYGNKGRKSFGNDIREGKLSALCAQHLLLKPVDHKKILNILNLDRDHTTSENIKLLKNSFSESGSLKLCMHFVQQKIEDIHNNKFLATNINLSNYFEKILKSLAKNFEEVNI